MKSRTGGLLASAIFVLCLAPGSALGERQRDRAPEARAAETAGTDPAQHGPRTGHLPAVRSNLDLVGSLELTGAFGDVLPEQIADVAVYKNYAYVNSRLGEDCDRCGFFVVDISNPAAPREVTFVRSLPGNFPGEGAHVITIDTPTFKGDVLAVNNEFSVDEPTAGGGFDLFDVTDPRNPRPLSRGVGDRCFDANCLLGPEPELTANSYHSVFLWQFGGRAYAVGVDNWESFDVDIFDITNPAAPVPVAEHRLRTMFPAEIADGTPYALGGNYAAAANVFNHDMVVKTIGGRAIMLVSYWDGGYVQIDVSDPENPTFVGDTSFDGADPEFPEHTPPEGNAHYAEFSHDNRFFLGADEDFAPERIAGNRMTVATGSRQGDYPAYTVGGAAPISALGDDRFNGPTVYGGYACPDPEGPSTGSAPVPQRSDYTDAELGLDPGEEAILVVQRGPSGDPAAPEGACFPGEKAETAIAAGWDAVLIVNHHAGGINVPYCGSGAFPPDQPIVAFCASHSALHALFPGTPTTGDYDVGDTHNPDIGDIGEHMSAAGAFDGWGYLHLYRNAADANGNFPQVDTHAVEESKDPRYAVGFGDLSIHEVATDPTEYLAYGAYYSAGVRVFQFGDGGIVETAAFIPQGGANVWGIEHYTGADGQRYAVASDRDFGLYILRYTGPGAAQPPACRDIDVSTPFDTPVTIPLTCTDVNGNPLRLSIATAPRHGTLGEIHGNSVRYTPASGFSGQDTFTYRANDGAANSNVATVRVTVGPAALLGRCVNRILGDAGNNRLIGTTAPDAVLGGAGNDAIEGLNGDDCLFGEAGNDQIEGSEGNDDVLGGDGLDRLFGGSGDDTVDGGKDRDHLNGVSGNDTLFGRGGNDFLGGGSNDDRLLGGPGRDSIRGEAGDDDISGGGGNDRIDVGKGNNEVSAGRGSDRVVTANGAEDVVNCGKGRDSVRADRQDIVARNCERVRRVVLTRNRR